MFLTFIFLKGIFQSCEIGSNFALCSDLKLYAALDAKLVLFCSVSRADARHSCDSNGVNYLSVCTLLVPSKPSYTTRFSGDSSLTQARVSLVQSLGLEAAEFSVDPAYFTICFAAFIDGLDLLIGSSSFNKPGLINVVGVIGFTSDFRF